MRIRLKSSGVAWGLWATDLIVPKRLMGAECETPNP
jgi:hypothetical protein